VLRPKRTVLNERQAGGRGDENTHSLAVDLGTALESLPTESGRLGGIAESLREQSGIGVE